MTYHLFKSKQNLLVLLTSACLLLLPGIFFWLSISNVQSLSQIQKQSTEANSVRMSLQNLEKSLYQYITEDHGYLFFEQKTDLSVENVLKGIDAVKENLKIFRKKNPPLETRALLDESLTILQDFETVFLHLKENDIEIGSEKYGHIASLIHQKKLLPDLLPSGTSYRLRAKQIEKITDLYLKYPLSGYAGEIKAQVKTLSALINKDLETPIKDKKILRNTLAEFLYSFSKIEQLRQSNGTIFTKGLTARLFMITQSLKGYNSKIIKKNEASFQTQRAQSKRNSLLFVILSYILIISLITISLQFLFKNLTSIGKQLHKINPQQPEDSVDFKKIIARLANMTQTHKPEENEKASSELSETSFEKNTQNIDNQENKEENKYDKSIIEIGRILRRYSKNQDLLCTKLIARLVHLSRSDLGGMYLIQTDSEGIKKLYLQASFAYDLQKKIKKDIAFGEGLVGTCGADKSPIYIKDLPEDYLKITTGLGYSTPKNLLLIPILNDEKEIFGVLEMAATRKYQKEDIEFLSILSGEIAYALADLQPTFSPSEES